MFALHVLRTAVHGLRASAAVPAKAMLHACALLLASAALMGHTAQAAGHEAVSADAAALALAQGARVVDVRSLGAFAAGHLPGAAHVPQHAAALPVAQLERLVSDAGVDLSRTVLVMGEPGDANAQALWHTLGTYASGRVLWLVGGALEWQLRGHALSTHTAAAPAVPQHLVLHQAQPTQVRMVGQSLRLGGVSSGVQQLSLNAK